MLFEIEFLAVGTGSRPGDAIIVRYGELEAYELMIIDGGTAETGRTMVAHLKKHFGEDVRIAHIVLTHSDLDHASGLREILRNIPVSNLWLHIPWLLAAEARHLFKQKNWTEEGLREAIRKEYDVIYEIVDLAIYAGCNVSYPFQGDTVGPFLVLSPSRYAYVHLLPQFDRTPDPDQSQLEALNMWIGKSSIVTQLLDKALARAQKWIPESWDLERLKDGGITSASNETSVILYGDFGSSRRVLLTGDAGVNALRWAADYGEASQLPFRSFSFVQMPHHGSRRNVGPAILNRILGPIQDQNSDSRFSAFVSAPADNDTHPRKMVLNAFIRRGGKIFATQGINIIHYGGFPKRDGYNDITSIPFSSRVEDYDS
jgi:beta-lactamase superfamily II metal-dependent hydrolase